MSRESRVIYACISIVSHGESVLEGLQVVRHTLERNKAI